MKILCIELISDGDGTWRLMGVPELRLERLESAYSNVNVDSLDSPSQETACWLVSGPTLDMNKLYCMVGRLCEADELIARIDSNPLASRGAIEMLSTHRSPEVAVAIQSYLPGRIENAVLLMKQSCDQVDYQARHAFRQIGNAKYDNAVALRNIADQIDCPAVQP